MARDMSSASAAAVMLPRSAMAAKTSAAMMRSMGWRVTLAWFVVYLIDMCNKDVHFMGFLYRTVQLKLAVSLIPCHAIPMRSSLTLNRFLRGLAAALCLGLVAGTPALAASALKLEVYNPGTRSIFPV